MPNANTVTPNPPWTWIVPALAAVLLATASIGLVAGALVTTACAIALIAAVFAAVHHAEVVAYRVGEPFGTLVLAIAVTVIEASLILSMIFTGGGGAARLARDTIYAAIMIICNGVIGSCVLVGGIAHREQTFRVEGAGAGFAALIAMSALSLVLPTFTISTPGNTYSPAQLAFASVASGALWAVFVFVQSSRHRDYFLPPDDSERTEDAGAAVSARAAWASFGLLLVSLIAVIGLAKVLSPAIERGVAAVGAPPAVIGIVIAMIVLMPETWAAVRAARADRLQTSMNLAIGSALASIGLTIPAVSIASIVFHIPLVLGLDPKDLVMLALTFLVGAVTLGTGRTHVMQGAIHLVVFAAFVFLAFVP